MIANRIAAVVREVGSRPNAITRSVPDPELIARFVDRHDEAAVRELVSRHLPAVWAVCRSVLRDPNDADDAAQATFQVFVRRVHGIRSGDAVGAWLCRVAWRTANRLRSRNSERAARHAPGVDPDGTAARLAPPGCDEDTRRALDEEIARLPERYRLAVLTCYVAGTPTADAAKQLGWPKGTLLTRLAWARRRLRDRLTRRGITLAGGFTVVYGNVTGRAGFALADRITRAAAALISGEAVPPGVVSERVSTLTEGMVRTMIGTNLKIVLGIGFVAAALLGLGLGRATVGTADAANPDGQPFVVRRPKQPEPAPTEPTPAVPYTAPDAVATAPVATPTRSTAPGDQLVVRRPLGSYTKEVPPFGKGTFTFTEDRLHITAELKIEEATLTITADADYSMNRESVVYGVITEVEVQSPALDPDGAAEVAFIAQSAVDLPFAFRVRTEDDSVSIKDIKVGPFGSPMLSAVLGGDGEEMAQMTMLVCGKYKLDLAAKR